MIEKIVDKKLLKVIKTKKNKKAEEILRGVYSLGRGESSVLHAFLGGGFDLIVSDDISFLRLIDLNRLSFLVPGDLIVRAVELKWLSPKEGTNAMNNIHELINEEEYNSCINTIKRKR